MEDWTIVGFIGEDLIFVIIDSTRASLGSARLGGVEGKGRLEIIELMVLPEGLELVLLDAEEDVEGDEEEEEEEEEELGEGEAVEGAERAAATAGLACCICPRAS